MSAPAKHSALLRDWGKVVSQTSVKKLRALGHAFAEGRREGAFLWDTEGNRYFDCYSSAGIHNLGRRPADLIAALRRDLRVADQGNFPMISREKAALAAKLAAFVPGSPECSIFSVVRGEGFDFACKLARGFTGRAELVAPAGSWFGHSGFALSLSDVAFKQDFAPLTPATRVVDFADTESIRAAITKATAAVLLEPMQIENHCAAFGTDLMRAIWERCGEVGALLIFDETQTGFGRTGRRFAFERYGIDPDAVILGEALGGGVFAIGATVISQRLNTFMNAHPLIHLSTFGGSDLGCTVGLAALDLYEQVAPWKNAAHQGPRLAEALEKLANPRGTGVRRVAGEGLVWSLEFSSAAKAVRFCNALAKHGVLAVPGLIARHTVVLRPPLTIDDNERKALVRAVAGAAADFK
jgi:putrescine aminotransferase